MYNSILLLGYFVTKKWVISKSTACLSHQMGEHLSLSNQCMQFSVANRIILLLFHGLHKFKGLLLDYIILSCCSVREQFPRMLVRLPCQSAIKVLWRETTSSEASQTRNMPPTHRGWCHVDSLMHHTDLWIVSRPLAPINHQGEKYYGRNNCRRRINRLSYLDSFWSVHKLDWLCLLVGLTRLKYITCRTK